MGNNCHLESERVVPKERGAAFAQSFDIPFMEISAETGCNVENAFENLALRILMVNYF